LVGTQGYDPFNYKLRTPVYLILVQRNAHPKDAASEIEKIVKIEGKRSFGVAAFGERFEESAKLGSTEAEIKKALGKIKFDKAARTTLYASIREAVQKLAAFPADRKALVVVSDGRSVQDSYAEKDAIDEARKNNVAIFSIAMTSTSDNSANLVALRKLAEDTDGIFIDAGSSPPHALPGDKATKFYDFLENGGALRLKTTDVPQDSNLSIRANIAGTGTSLAAEKIPVIAAATGDVWRNVSSWTRSNPMSVAALAVMTAGLLTLGFAMTRRARAPAPIVGAPGAADEDYERTSKYGRSGDPTALRENSDTVILTPMNDRGAPDKVYAWLQFLDANSTRVPIGSTSVRIGRHQDNDICLQNNSVHRQHAVLHMSPEHRFVIRDLGTSNGVVVNSRRVDQKELADGDLIELGEVRARFFANREVFLH
jgi:hypothetical protein